MPMKNLLFAVFLLLSIPAIAATETGAQGEGALAGIEWRNVEKILAKHFSIADIAQLKDYMKRAMIGLPTPMSGDLKAKVRNFMTEMRLEYGFQVAVIIAQLRKKIFCVLPPDLAELAEEFAQKPNTDLDE